MGGAAEDTANFGSGDEPIDDSLATQMMSMAAALWASRQRHKVVALLVALVAVVGATAFEQIQLNAWNQPFYNALARKDMSGFLTQLGVFAEVAGALLVLNVAQTWLNQKSKLILRKGLVENLLTSWLARLRAVRLSQAGEIGENPDQRIHEDARHLTELSTDLGIGLLQSTLLLASFIGVLWLLSGSMVVSIGGFTFVAPGYMVWCVLLYSGIASLLSWRVGRSLIHLNADRYAHEAQLRAALVQTNEEIEGVTLNGAEPDAKAHLASIFNGVAQILERIVLATTGLTWVTASAGWLAIVAPILVAAPAYFYGSMTFGKLMMVVGAFNQVQQALGWFASNFSSIADWRATLLRIANFRKTLLTIDKFGEGASQIELDGQHEESIVIDELSIATPTGRLALSEPHLVVKPGDHVLITGDEDSERMLFQAIAGLWPWGSGHIARPPRQLMVFMPTPGFVAPGTLRTSLAYPHPPETYDDARVHEALVAVGLEHFAPLVDANERWDRRLSDDEKQRVAMARVLLVKPGWLVLNRALAALDPESAQRLVAAFEGGMPDVGVIYVGKRPGVNGFFQRTLTIAADPQGPRFQPAYRAEVADRREAAAVPGR